MKTKKKWMIFWKWKLSWKGIEFGSRKRKKKNVYL